MLRGVLPVISMYIGSSIEEEEDEDEEEEKDRDEECNWCLASLIKVSRLSLLLPQSVRLPVSTSS